MDIEPLAGRFEFGTMAYGCALGLGKAVEFILGLGSDAIFDRSESRFFICVINCIYITVRIPVLFSTHVLRF